jgi:CRISPR/Cas system CMR subunit Cmr6 (Cas7 group RAMP superfamily)
VEISPLLPYVGVKIHCLVSDSNLVASEDTLSGESLRFILDFTLFGIKMTLWYKNDFILEIIIELHYVFGVPVIPLKEVGNS